jgi:hypothetical protein
LRRISGGVDFRISISTAANLFHDQQMQVLLPEDSFLNEFSILQKNLRLHHFLTACAEVGAYAKVGAYTCMTVGANCRVGAKLAHLLVLKKPSADAI